MLNGVEGMRACLGIYLGHSDWLEVDRAMLERFDSLTEDRLPSHVDRSVQMFAPRGVVLAVLIPLLQQIYVFENTLNVALDRIDQLQFMAPVPIGSGLRVGTTVKAVQPAANDWQLNLECVMECDALVEPVLRANVLYRFDSESESDMSQSVLMQIRPGCCC